MKKASTREYKSKVIAWTTPGNGELVFDASCVPDQGDNGGINVISRIVLHATINRTVGTAVIQGEDVCRAFRKVTITQKDGEKRFADILGDAARLISYAHNGAVRTHEHQDGAVDTSDMLCTLAVPMSKPFAHDEDDTALPAYLLDTVAITQPTNADLSIGTSVVAIVSASFWLIFECYEESAPVHHSLDLFQQVDMETTTGGTIAVNGRLQDVYLYVRGANGGASLANLTDAKVDLRMMAALLRTPDLKQLYARKRDCATNLFSTKGNPVRSDPFSVSDSGTMRALAVMLTAGDKVWEGPEQRTAFLRVTLASALTPITMISRVLKRRTTAMREMIMDIHKVNAGFIRTEGKTKMSHNDWDPIRAAYMPEEFYATSGGRRVPFKLFSGKR